MRIHYVSFAQVKGPLSAWQKESFKPLQVQVKVRHQKKTIQTNGQVTPIEVINITQP